MNRRQFLSSVSAAALLAALPLPLVMGRAAKAAGKVWALQWTFYYQVNADGVWFKSSSDGDILEWVKKAV